MPPFVPRPHSAEILLKSLIQSKPAYLYFRKKAVIFSQGDPADSLFYVQTGTIKLTVISEEGREAVIRLCKPGSFFGYCCLTNDPGRRHQNAVALTEAELLIIRRDSISHILRSNSEVLAAFVWQLLDRVVTLETDLASSLMDSKEQRLARVLLSLTQRQNEIKPELMAGINQQTLAEMVGTTRQRVNVLLKRFRRLGFIEENSKNVIEKNDRNASKARLAFPVSANAKAPGYTPTYACATAPLQMLETRKSAARALYDQSRDRQETFMAQASDADGE